jgi:hypothetical protein
MSRALTILFSLCVLSACCFGSSNDSEEEEQSSSSSESSSSAGEGDECEAYSECCDALEDTSLEPLKAGCRREPAGEADCEGRMRMMRTVAARNSALPDECR